MWKDLRFAAQALVRNPVFTVAATLALGLAIGANAAIFGLVDGLWLRRPGVRSPGEIVRIFATTPSAARGIWSFPEYQRLRDTTTAFDGVVVRGRRGAVMHAADGSRALLLVNVVSNNFFSTLGVQPAHGRVFLPGDEAALDAQPGVVLGHAFWERQFGGDTSIVGRTITLDRGVPLAVNVLGVLPSTFRDLEAAADRDLWIPPQTWIRLANRAELERWDERWFDVIARRRPGVSVDAAQAEVVAVTASMAAEFPRTNAGRSAHVLSDFDYRMESAGTSAAALLGLVLLVVSITCVNIANLLLARAAARSRELAVRVALGAGRWRLFRQLMTESALLGCLGAVAGIMIAMWLIRLLPAFLVTPPGFHSLLLFQTDGRVLAFTAAVTLVTTVLFGTAPSWLAARADLGPIMKGESRILGGSRADGLVPRVLVAAQVAISFVLLCAAAVLVRSFIATQRADIGIARKSLLTAWITQADVPRATAEAAVERVRALPGVSRVGVAIRAPLSLSGGGMAHPVFLPHSPPAAGDGLPEVKFNAVSANYFSIIGTRLRRGRLFTGSDERPGEGAIVVNEQFARQFFAGSEPIGMMIRLGGAAGMEHRIIGVVQNAPIEAIGEMTVPYFYLPYWRGRYGEMTLFIEGARDPAVLSQAIRVALIEMDARLEPRRFVTMPEYIRYSASIYQATAALGAALGFIGLLLTALGVYGVVAYQTGRRTREFGIRLALGAGRAQVLGLVLRQGLQVVVLGLAVGVPAALGATTLIGSMLFATQPWDVLAFGAAAGVLVAAVCLATLVPARRALRVSPSAALRDA